MEENYYGQFMGFAPIAAPTPVAPVPNFTEPNFNGNIIPGMPQMVTPQFNVMTPERAAEIPMAQFIPPVYVSDYQPKTVGLPMDGLITPVPEQAPVKFVTAEFDNLVKENVIQAPNTFGVQPIPEGMDRSMLPKTNTLIDNAINEVNAHLSKSNITQPNLTKGHKLNNWFTRLLDQRGQDYITSGKLTIDEVSRNAEKILDDMISGRINYDTQAQYIIQPIILETLINYCSNKLAINRAIQFALGYLYNDYVNRGLIQDPRRLEDLAQINDGLSRNITQAISIVNQDIDVYTILFNKLVYTNDTKNASALFSLSNDLNNYKKQMKKRY